MAQATLVDVEEALNAVPEGEPQPTMEESLQSVEEPVEPQETEEDLPEKYRGKSLKELAEMHMNAEKLMGKQSSEVGELRKIVDEFIQSQTTKDTTQVDDSDDEVDFYVDPDRAVAKAIDNHPTIRQAKEMAHMSRMEAAKNQLQSKHPDFMTINQDPKFAEWIMASKVRTKLFVEADQKFDVDSADELYTLWKERQGSVQNTVNAEKAARKETLKSVNTGTAQGSNEPAAKKKYRRADLIKLMQTDPERYEQLQPEIMAAYREKRVI